MKVFAVTILTLLTTTSMAADRPKRELDLSKPLGSMENPVQACSPAGQREYLMRLRCATGEAPKFSRSGNLGEGPYGNFVDAYKLECQSGDTQVIMDMYRCRHRELKPVPGFTVLAELPAKIAKGCPPAVPGEPLGRYAFNALEVETPVKRPSEIDNPPKLSVGGKAYYSLVVDEKGMADPETIEVKYLQNEAIRGRAIEYVKGMKFTPAVHHESCTVRQRVEFGINFLPEQ